MVPIPVITIDGPSGTGKGTLCHLLAQHLQWHVLDSGILYRILALTAQQNGIAMDNVQALLILHSQLDIQFTADSSFNSEVILNGRRIHEEVRSELCGQNASRIGAIPAIRQALLDNQRRCVRYPGLVADGRDMGTVVFPDAKTKIYLDATSKERATRRYYQLRNRGIDVSLPNIMADLAMRDTRDAERHSSPLKPAPDAIYIDTTALNIMELFDIVVKLVA